MRFESLPKGAKNCRIPGITQIKFDIFELEWRCVYNLKKDVSIDLDPENRVLVLTFDGPFPPLKPHVF